MPPPQYPMWWKVTEECAGLSADARQISWYVVPDVDYIVRGNDTILGSWYPVGNRIVLASRSVNDGLVVRHEMLHALARANHHPPELFQGRCGGLVDCVGACLSEGHWQPDPPQSAPLLRPEDLGIGVEVLPAAYSRPEAGGWIVVIVSVTNPLDEPAWVRLYLPPTSSMPEQFGYTLGSSRGATEITPQTRVGFAAHSTKRSAFDVQIDALDGTNALPAGDYEVRGTFNTLVSAPLVYRVP